MALGLSSRALIGEFYTTLEEPIGGAWEQQLGMSFESDQDSETYRWLGMAPAVREWLGARQIKQLRTQGITVVNKDFETTIEIPVSDLRRDKTGQTRIRIAELADRMSMHWRSLLTTLIINGDTTTSGLCYDGQEFFDTDHSEGSSGTQLNDLAAAQVAALDVTTAAAPSPAEFAQAILGVIAYMYGYKDDQGEPMNEGARAWLVMVPVNLSGSAQQAVHGEMLFDSSGTIITTPFKGTDFTIDVVTNPRLTVTTEFYVFRTDGRTRPFILQQESAPQVEVIGEGSEEEFKNRRHLFGVKAARNAAYGQWQYASLSTLS